MHKKLISRSDKTIARLKKEGRVTEVSIENLDSPETYKRIEKVREDYLRKNAGSRIVASKIVLN